jgi:hypothetical protein
MKLSKLEGRYGVRLAIAKSGSLEDQEPSRFHQWFCQGAKRAGADVFQKMEATPVKRPILNLRILQTMKFND